MWRQADDAEQDDIAEDTFGLLGGGDEPVFAVVVEKDPEFVAGFGVVWRKSFWQQDAVAAVIEDEAHGELSFNDQGIVFADVDHRVKIRLWTKTGRCDVETRRRRGGVLLGVGIEFVYANQNSWYFSQMRMSILYLFAVALMGCHGSGGSNIRLGDGTRYVNNTGDAQWVTLPDSSRDQARRWDDGHTGGEVYEWRPGGGPGWGGDV